MQYFGDSANALAVINVRDIHSVVIMAPDNHYKLRYKDGTEHNREFLVEEFGTKVLRQILGNRNDSEEGNQDNDDSDDEQMEV